MGMMNIYDIQDAKSQEDLNYGKMMGNTQQGRTAVSVMGMMGSQLGSAAGSLLGGRTPQEQKMDKVQEIQAKFGEPETQEDLNNIIVAFKEAGMPDLATQLTKDFGDMLKIRGLLNEPELKTEWRLDVGKNFTTLYANENLPGQPEGLDTRTKIIKYLNSLVSAGTIKNQIKKDWMKDYDLAYKAKGEAYVSTNALKGKQAGKGGVSADSVLSQDKKLDIPKTAEAQQRILVRELESLPEIARLAAQANPKNNQAIYAELKKRQLELHSKINALTPKIDEEALSEYHGQATSIFDTNAAKYKKNPNYY